MTSAHRPTFDPVKGKADQMRSTVTHARSLPSHTKMKYRRATKVEDLEGKTTESKKSDDENEDQDEDEMTSDSKRVSVQVALGEENRDNDDEPPDSQEQVEQSNLASSQIQLNNSESSEYESESEDEESLLRELEKIKQERKEKKMEEIEIEMRTLPQKRSWRNSTFRNANSKKTTTDKKASYTNDTLKTDYHQKFMDKFIK